MDNRPPSFNVEVWRDLQTGDWRVRAINRDTADIYEKRLSATEARRFYWPTDDSREEGDARVRQFLEQLARQEATYARL